jgi:hypothetical protein
MGTIAYHYDPAKKLVRARAEGIVSAEEILAYVRSIVDDPAIQPGFVEVVDFDAAKDMVVSYSQLPPFQQIWKKYLAKGCRAVLLYATSDVSYGICRMFQAVIDPDGDQADVPFIIVKSVEELGAKLGELGIEGPV